MIKRKLLILSLIASLISNALAIAIIILSIINLNTYEFNLLILVFLILPILLILISLASGVLFYKKQNEIKPNYSYSEIIKIKKGSTILLNAMIILPFLIFATIRIPIFLTESSEFLIFDGGGLFILLPILQILTFFISLIFILQIMMIVSKILFLTNPKTATNHYFRLDNQLIIPERLRNGCDVKIIKLLESEINNFKRRKAELEISKTEIDISKNENNFDQDDIFNVSKNK